MLVSVPVLDLAVAAGGHDVVGRRRKELDGHHGVRVAEQRLVAVAKVQAPYLDRSVRAARDDEAGVGADVHGQDWQLVAVQTHEELRIKKKELPALPITAVQVCKRDESCKMRGGNGIDYRCASLQTKKVGELRGDIGAVR